MDSLKGSYLEYINLPQRNRDLGRMKISALLNVRLNPFPPSTPVHKEPSLSSGDDTGREEFVMLLQKSQPRSVKILDNDLGFATGFSGTSKVV